MTPIPKPDKPIRMVVCAANRNWVTHELVLGPRHFDPTMREQIKTRVHSYTSGRAEDIAAAAEDLRHWSASQQGFIDQWGSFMTREEAWVVALAAGQVRYGPHLSGGKLDSSDLW